jgi:hypothetical protein
MRALRELVSASSALEPAGRALALRDLAAWPRVGLAHACEALAAAAGDPDPGVQAISALELDHLRARTLREVLAIPEPAPDPFLRLAGASLPEPAPPPPSLRRALEESLVPLRDRLLEQLATSGPTAPLLEVLGALGGELVVAALAKAGEGSGAPRVQVLRAAYRAGGPEPIAGAVLAAHRDGEDGALLLAGSEEGLEALQAAAGASASDALAAAWACRDLGLARARPVLELLATRSEEVVVAHALRTLEGDADPGVVELVLRILERAEDPDLRGRALGVLAARGASEARTLSLRALKLGPDSLRLDALAALADLGFDAREKKRRVARLTESRDLEVAAAALISLSLQAPREMTQGPLRRLVARGEEASLLVAARCLGYLPSPSSRLLLARLAELDSPLVAFEAARSLGRHPRDEAVTETLKSLLAAPGVAGRAAAAASLTCAVHVGDLEVIEGLRRYWDEDREGRADGLRGLGALSRGELTPLLAEVAWEEARELAEPALDGLLALRVAPPQDVLQWSGRQPEAWRRARAALARWSGGEVRALDELVPMLASADPEAPSEAAWALRDAALLVRHVPELPGLAPLRQALSLELEATETSYQPPPLLEVDEALGELELPRVLASTPELGAFLDLPAKELARLYRKAPELVSEYRLALMLALLVMAQVAGLAFGKRGELLPEAPVVGRADLAGGEGLAVLVAQGGRWTQEGGSPRSLGPDAAPLRPPGHLAAGEGESVRVVAGPVEGNHVTLVGPGELGLGEVEASGPSEFDYRLRIEARRGTTRLRATWGRPEITLEFGSYSLRVGRAVLDIALTDAAPAQLSLYWGAGHLTGPDGETVELAAGSRYVLDEEGGREAILLDGS